MSIKNNERNNHMDEQLNGMQAIINKLQGAIANFKQAERILQACQEEYSKASFEYFQDKLKKENETK